MAIDISDSGPKIIFKNGTLRRDILKSSIREVTLLRGTIVKIEIGNKPLKNIYVDQLKVSVPVTASPGDLRNQILAMLQSQELAVLTDLKTNSDDVKAFSEPTLIDSSVEGVTYKGYADIGHAVIDSAVWAIQRIALADGVTTYLWAESNRTFDKVWNDRATYTYS